MELLIVELDHAYLGIPTSDVTEVLRAARISPALGANANIKGMLNLRGDVVPVASMRVLLGMAERDIVSTDHFVVLHFETNKFVIHVDRAIEIANINSPMSVQSDQMVAASVPHAEFGVVHVHRAGSLWRGAGLSSSTVAPNMAQREEVMSP